MKKFQNKMTLLSLWCWTGFIWANPVQTILNNYEKQAKQEVKNFAGFSTEEGKKLYFHEQTKDGKMVSCSSCHSKDPRQEGLSRANKIIKPLAPQINPERFTDIKKVEKWFLRNCDDVLSRPCTVIEKGNFISFLISLK